MFYNLVELSISTYYKLLFVIIKQSEIDNNAWTCVHLWLQLLETDLISETNGNLINMKWKIMKLITIISFGENKAKWLLYLKVWWLLNSWANADFKFAIENEIIIQTVG